MGLRTVDIFQPTEAQVRHIINPVYSDSVDYTTAKYGNSQSVLIVDDIPFASYWQNRSQKTFIFHPMLYGRHIFNLKNTSVEKIAHVTRKLGVALPNGGIAFYYPNLYQLNRMMGAEYQYSCISQSEILAGYLRQYMISDSTKMLELVEKIKQGLLFPYSDGGVNLANVALLEMPMFHSTPEIILNGWLHALLHLVDYTLLQCDPALALLIEKNLQFFADNYEIWWDAKLNISRYSDSCSHRIVITPTNKEQKFKIICKSLVPELNDYEFDPVVDLENTNCSYDNKIVNINPNGKITMNITCSGLFDTSIVSRSPFTVKIKSEEYSPMRSSPAVSDTIHELIAKSKSQQFEVEMKLEEGKLFMGYPTNFAKDNKKNYYHIQHIVALLYLANTFHFDNCLIKKRIIEIGLHWWHKTKLFKYMSYTFEDPQVVLDDINMGKLFTQITSIEELGLL